MQLLPKPQAQFASTLAALESLVLTELYILQTDAAYCISYSFLVTYKK